MKKAILVLCGILLLPWMGSAEPQVENNSITVTGIVRDETGAPVMGALVQMGEGAWRLDKDTDTNEQGEFAVENMKEGPAHICIQAPGKAPFVQRLSADEVAKPLEFKLEPGETIRIRVVDTDGSPIEGVNVSAGTYKGYRRVVRMGKSGDQRRITTDADGMAVWDSAPADAVQYSFNKESFAYLEEVELVAGDEMHTVVLPKPIRISGTVVDKETGEPIKKFKVVPVLDWLTGATPYLERMKTFEAEAGQYEWKTGRTDTGHYVRIEAEGYRPAMSEMFRVGEAEEKTIHFELTKVENIEGVIMDPDGKPVEGAEVFVSTGLHRLSIGNSEVRSKKQEKMVKTGPDGRFLFSPETGACLLVAMHETGYAQQTAEQTLATGEIRLAPWGRIEGKLVRGGKPVADYKIRMYPVRLDSANTPVPHAQYYTDTNENGVFVFERVAPGPVTLAPELGPWKEYAISSAEKVPIIVEPGKTVKLDLGGSGRMVMGKAELPAGIDRKMHWDCGINYLVAMKDGIPVPEEIKDLDFDWRNGWKETWTATREGRAYFQTLFSHYVKLNRDGTFHVEGVAPGNYQLVLRVYDPPEGGG